MIPPPEMLDAEETVQGALAKISETGERTQLVGNSRGIVGVVTQKQLLKESAEGGGAKKLGDLAGNEEFPHVHADHSLDLALARMGETHADLLPVVGRANVHELLGVVRLGDVLKSYGVDAHGED